MIYFTCSKEDLVPIVWGNVRWLDQTVDYELAKHYWQALGYPLSQRTWRSAHEYGYRYAAIIKNDQIISCAGEWRFSEDCGEIAAVSTLEQYRRRGASKQVVAFITDYILSKGKTATCSTDDDNIAMIATAKSVGYREIPKDKVWWTYPRLPEF